MRAYIMKVLCASIAMATASGGDAKPPTVVERLFGVGDLVFSRQIMEPLPNAFGGSDIFGRKRSRGMIELRYVGAPEPGRALFHRRDVSVLTNETTMNRSRHFVANGSQSGSSATVYGSISSAAKIETLPADAIAILVDLRADPTMLVAGTAIRVLEATPSKVLVEITTPMN